MITPINNQKVAYSQQENSDNKDANLKHLKLNCFKEFIKRLYYESKYVNIAKLCEEYLEELLDNLDQILKDQQLCLETFINNCENSEYNINKQGINGNSLYKDLNEDYKSLYSITEQSEGEEDSCDNSIVGKINKIQDKLYKIENIGENIKLKYETEINSLKIYISSLTEEIEQYKYHPSNNVCTDFENKKCLFQSTLYENIANYSLESSKDIIKDISFSMSLKENRSTNADNSISENCTKDSYLVLHRKFDALQKNFNQLQEYVKTKNIKNISNRLNSSASKNKRNKQQNIKVNKISSGYH